MIKGKTNLEALAVKINGNHYQRYISAKISLLDINILVQPRRTFEDIELLADDMADKGQLCDPIVAEFKPANAQEYLEVVNEIWNTNYQINDLSPTRKKNGNLVYYILLAGERRCRGLRHVWYIGCSVCLAKYGQETAGKCFKRHFGKHNQNKISVKLCVDLDSLDAQEIQLSENTHMPVPPHQEAEAYNRVYRLEKKRNPEITLADFARKVGRSDSTMRNAMRYCELPPRISKLVEQGFIVYSAALEIWRLRRDAKIQDEEELEIWALQACGKKIIDFRKMVDERIRISQSGQQSFLMDAFSESQELVDKQIRKRKVIASELIRVLCFAEEYLTKIAYFYEAGILGVAESPFSERSVLRHLHKQVDLLERLLPFMRATLAAKAKNVIFEAKNLINNLGLVIDEF